MKAAKIALSTLMCAALALFAAGATCAAEVARTLAVNAKAEAHIPGKFIWFDCVTDDLNASKAFYGALVRVVLATGGVARASIIELPKDVAESGWLPFVQVDDVAAAVRNTTALGGTIVLAPRPNLLNGHVAVVADPHGAVLGVVNRNEAARK